MHPPSFQDVHEITGLVYRYGELLDDGDVDGYAALFEHAVIRTDRNPDGYVGSEGVRELVRRFVRLYDGAPSTRHLFTNVHVEMVDADTATARSSVVVFQARPELPLQPVFVGHYRDRFVRGPDGWRFDERRITADLLGDLSMHVPMLTEPRD